MTKIVIIGIGGVGGYFGGLLAKHYEHSEEVQVYFVARGEHEKAIREKGLLVKSTTGDFTARPKLVTSDPGHIGTADYILLCTKGYNLEESLASIGPCIGKDTIMLPLLNGVNAKDRIKAVFPEQEVWEGAVYIASRLVEPGVVAETGKVTQFYFGSENGDAGRLAQFEKILRDAGVEISLSPDIQRTVWEKFLFISTVATATTYLNASIGAIMADPGKRNLLDSLLKELFDLAQKKGIGLPADAIDVVVARLGRVPYEVTSSMHSDTLAGKKTEADSLTGYVVKEGQKLGLEMMVYNDLWEEMQGRSGQNA